MEITIIAYSLVFMFLLLLALTIYVCQIKDRVVDKRRFIIPPRDFYWTVYKLRLHQKRMDNDIQAGNEPDEYDLLYEKENIKEVDKYLQVLQEMQRDINDLDTSMEIDFLDIWDPQVKGKDK